MNKITQSALAALVLGACSTASFAEDEAARGGYHPPKPPIDWSKCNTLGCEKEIPISLKINKKKSSIKFLLLTVIIEDKVYVKVFKNM